jgi:hypothetical protein
MPRGDVLTGKHGLLSVRDRPSASAGFGRPSPQLPIQLEKRLFSPRFEPKIALHRRVAW